MNQLKQHWLGVTLGLFFVFNAGAWTAPLLMQWGFAGAGKLVYTLYSPFCHQMAQRSFFLFGEKTMYSPDELGVPLTNTNADTLLMRKFRGNTELGWKVAWSDRMVYMYGGMWLAMLIYALYSQRHPVQPLSIWLLLLAMLPMALDGGTHLLSDFSGLFEGFRYQNEWLAALTGHLFSSSFYEGDALGSFNAWMRLISGLAFGFGVIWFALPHVSRVMDYSA